MVETFPQLFADTSSIPEIEKLMHLGIFSGITTNPLIVAKEAENREPADYYQELAKKYPDVPISIQLLDGNEHSLLEEAYKFAGISENIVIKVPMFRDGRGLAVASVLNKEGIPTNVTGLMNTEQLFLAVLTGATYVSLFFNRIKDSEGDPTKEIVQSRKLIDSICSKSKIITGSIRKIKDITQAIVAGSHIVTIPPQRVWEMVYHPQTEKFINQCQTDWNNFLKNSQGV